MTFGGWLRQRRKERGITYEELAERIGCSRITIVKLEAGERRPSRQIAELVADFFGIPPDEREPFITFARTGQATVTSAPLSLASPDQALSRAPWREAYLHKTNLPAPLTALIGREEDAAEARGLLLQPRVRLLTMVGPPGIGKTRLALQVTQEVVDQFEAGVFLVELAPISDPELVLPTIARTLQLKETGASSIEEALLAHLHDKRVLLLLDNFEQVLDAALDVVKLLEASPWLKVLVTSREALHVRGERRFSVPPLQVPSTEYRVPSTSDPLSTRYPLLATIPSVELFVERAQAVAPDFELTPENAGDVAAVCVGLEGLPLAIELAATRARHFSPGELRAGLDNRLRLLTGGGQDLPVRQRTLRRAIEWSYDLLDNQEQVIFRRLGIFVGGFTAAAAEAVCQEGAEVVGQTSTLDVLLSLVDKSLVKQESLGREGGEARFGMLEAIREHAREQLSEHGQREEAEEIARRHALYFMRLAEEGEPQLVGAGQVKWLERLESEYGNLRAALGWAKKESHKHSTDDKGGPTQEVVEGIEVGVRLAGALYRFWRVRGYLSEGREQLAMALASLNSLSEASISVQASRAKALHGVGVLAYMQGDHDEAVSHYQESLAIQRRLGDKGGIALSLNNLGLVAFMEADYAEARSLHEESLALRREVGDKRGIAASLGNLGLVAYMQGDYAAAYSQHKESLALCREISDKWGIAVALGNLGNVVRMRGDNLAARPFYLESLAIRQEIGDNIGMAVTVGALGSVAAELGEAQRGARLLGAATALWKGMSFVPEVDDRIVYERGIASAQVQLGDEAFEEAWAEGQAMPIEEAVEYALAL